MTDAGVAYAKEHAAPLLPSEVEHLAIGYMNVKLKVAPDAAPLDDVTLVSPEIASATVSPDERLEQALQKLRAARPANLLDNLLQVSLNRLEVIVLDVLHRLVYGASRNDRQRVGGSGDARVDKQFVILE